MPIVAMPDGNQVQFPDEMQPEQIKTLIATKFPAAAQPQANPNDLPQPQDQSYVNNVGRYQKENWDTAKQEVSNAFQPYKEDNSPGPLWLKEVGHHVGNLISGVGGAITSGPTSMVQAGVQSVANAVYNQDAPKDAGPAPQSELQHAHDLAGAEGAMGTNVGMALLGGRAGMAPETEQMGSTLKSVRDMRKPIPESDILVKANKGTLKESVFGGAPDPTRAGESAIGKLNTAYEGASKSSEDAYTTLKAIPYKAQAPDFYQTANKLSDELSKKIAPGTDEEYALNNFKEILDEAQTKYGKPGSPAGAPLNLQQILNGAKPPKGAVAPTPASELSLPEAIEIKTGLNSLLDTLSSKREFSTSGMRSINQLKSSVQTFIDDAAKSDPAIKQAINTAEEAAYRKSQFKVPELRDMWTQEDYNGYQAGKNNPDKPWLKETPVGTTSRADTFLEKLNASDKDGGTAGKVRAIIRTLPPEEAVQVLHDALSKGRSDSPILVNGRWVLRDLAANTSPGVVGSRLLNPFPKESALIDLTKRAQDAARKPTLPTRTVQGAVAGAANDAEITKKELTNEQKAVKLKGQSINLNSKNGTPSSPATNGNPNAAPGKRGDSTVLPDSKKNSANVDTGYLVDNLGLKDDTSKALAKSNADSIVKVASESGADPVHLLKMAASESHLGTNTGKGNKGLFQITDNAFKLLKDKYPEEMKNLKRQNTEDNVKMAILLSKSDAEDFQKHTGKAPTTEDQRLLHVLGLGATLTLARNDTKSVAARTLSPSLQVAAENNHNLFVTKDNKNVSPALLKKNIVGDYHKWDKYIRTSVDTASSTND